MSENTERPSAIGPYRIREVLGRGGMGVVYRAEHEETGAAVALKTLHSQSQGHLASLRREIEALGGLRHPGVVGIVGHGVSNGTPWYAMDLLRGQTLRHCLAFGVEDRADGATTPPTATRPLTDPTRGARTALTRTPIGAATRRRALAIVMQCCDALSYIHAMGVVHRDLKPENIFVLDDGSPVLVDLGLAASFGGRHGREQLDIATGPLGTVAYMAPEQVRGELVDARADLYAIGCILYECIAGEPPFAGVPSFAVLDAHLRKRPLPPSAVADEVPPVLDELILRLLEKHPHNRVGYAEDIAAALKTYATGLPRSTVVPSIQRPYLYRPPFVGREAVAMELKNAVLRIGSSRGHIYIGGESGVGKTRLVLEIINHVVCHDATIVLSRCGTVRVGADAASSDRPLQAFASALLALVDQSRSEAERTGGPRPPSWAKVLAPYQPALEHIPGYVTLPEPAAVGPREARERVLDALDEALHSLAAARPLVVAIDDLQWADELSLAYLSRVTARTGPLLIIATYRADEAREMLREVVAAPSAVHIELARFGHDVVGAMVRGMLALDTPPPQLIRFLESRCDGNPFFVVSYLQAAIGEGVLTREVGGRWQIDPSHELLDIDRGLAMPIELTELIELRLRRLSTGCLNLVEAGAVLGREFDTGLLTECASLEAEVVTQLLQTLKERQILEPADNGALRFVHDKIRETAYARLPVSTARELHRRAAERIEQRSAGAPEASQVLAVHYSRAGVHDRSAIYFDRAGDFAANAYASGEAVQLYRAGIHELSIASDVNTNITTQRLLEKSGDVLSVVGKPDEARTCFEEALGCRTGADRLAPARLLRKVGKTWEVRHDYVGALRDYARGAEALGETGLRRDENWWREVVQVTTERLWVHYWLNNVEEMNRLIEQSTSVIEQRGTPYQRARFKQLIAMRNMRQERYLVSAETVALAQAAAEAARDNSEEEKAALGFVLFFALFLHGSFEAAERQGHSVLDWATRAGASTLRVRTLTYLTANARKQGRIERVRELVEEVLAMYDPMAPGHAPSAPTVHYRGALLANMSWVALRERKYDESEAYARSALDSWKSERVPYAFQWLARFPLLAISALRGDKLEAARFAAELLSDDEQRFEQPLTEVLGTQVERARRNSKTFDSAAILRVARRYHYL